MARYRQGMLEIILDPKHIEQRATEDLIGYYHGMKISEPINVLREAIFDELLLIIGNNLTPRQKQILELFLQGMKQEEIAAELNIVQPCVSLHLHGVPDYKRGKTYGGIIKKLRKLCKKNEKIQDLLVEIRTYKEAE